MSRKKHEILREKVEELLRNGRIWENIVHVQYQSCLPKEGWKLKNVCGQLRYQQNNRTISISVPRLEELLEQLNGAKVVTKIALWSSYHQIKICLGDEWKTVQNKRCSLLVVSHTIQIVKYVQHIHAPYNPGSQVLYAPISIHVLAFLRKNEMFWT